MPVMIPRSRSRCSLENYVENTCVRNAHTVDKKNHFRPFQIVADLMCSLSVDRYETDSKLMGNTSMEDCNNNTKEDNEDESIL